MSSYKPVTAALRVLDVLAAVNRLDGDGSVGDIHHQTGIDKSTIVRMLQTLESAGYVVRKPDRPSYGVTGKTLVLSASFDRQKAMCDALSPFLNAFREEIGWPSDIAVFDHDAMVVIETSRHSGPLSFNRTPGYRAPLLGTSLGLVYVANSSIAHRNEIRQASASIDEPWNKFAQDEKTFHTRMDEIRKLGFATMDPEYSKREYRNKVASIGVPIFRDGIVIATINTIYLKQVMTANDAKETLLPKLLLVAWEMGKKLQEQKSCNEES